VFKAFVRTTAWVVAASVTVAGQNSPGELPALLAKVGAHVEAYYRRAQSIVCREVVHMQPMGWGNSPEGIARRLEHELRVEWDASSDGYPTSARVIRERLSAGGRPLGSPDDPECFDSNAVSPEPLAMLLPARQADHTFTWAGTGRVDGRDAVMVDYKPNNPKPSIVSWDGSCGSVEVPALVRGRLWLDPLSGEVLRLDERLAGQFDFAATEETVRRGGPMFFVLERSDSTVRYKPITFTDPDETLMLPSSVDSFTVIRNSGVPRLRTSQKYTDYRRFLTGGRIVQ
jgi:hypothetical protein